MPIEPTETRREPHLSANATTARDAPLDLNAVVAYNVKAIRLARRLTQDQVAERLARFTGHRLPQASISQMERSFDGKRRRLFDAQDLYLLSKVFEVPIVYFFLPPPPCLGETVAHSGEPVSALLDAVFGTPSSLRAVDGRLVEIAHLARHAAASRRGHDPRHGLDHSVTAPAPCRWPTATRGSNRSAPSSTNSSSTIGLTRA